MSESPIFTKVYDLIVWLVPKTTKFPREYRFSLALPMQQHAFALQRHLVAAAKASDRRGAASCLQDADIELTLLRYMVRLSRDLSVLESGYEHVSRLLDEVGRLLGGWQKSLNIKP